MFHTFLAETDMFHEYVNFQTTARWDNEEVIMLAARDSPDPHFYILVDFDWRKTDRSREFWVDLYLKWEKYIPH